MFNFFLDTSLPIDILRSELTAYRPGECHPLIDKEQIKRKHNILVTATNAKLHSYALELKKGSSNPPAYKLSPRLSNKIPFTKSTTKSAFSKQ